MSLARKCSFSPTLSGICLPAAGPCPQAEIRALLLKISPSLFLWWMAESNCSEKRLEECKKETGTSLHPDWWGCEEPWGQFLPSFASLLLQMVYQALLDCARCFQGPVDASVSIIIAFFHVGRNYGRSQCISISLFSQISAISSNPSDKAKPKLSFNLQSTYQPLCLCPDQVLQRI